jgi:hypothetical protein
MGVKPKGLTPIGVKISPGGPVAPSGGSVALQPQGVIRSSEAASWNAVSGVSLFMRPGLYWLRVGILVSPIRAILTV